MKLKNILISIGLAFGVSVFAANPGNYVYTGASARVGHFGTVTNGQTVTLTADDAASLNTAIWVPAPVASKVHINTNDSITLDNSANGAIVYENHTGAVTVTLPASPTNGTQFEVYFAPSAATNTVTIEPGITNRIRGVAEVKTIQSATITQYGSYSNSNPTITVTGGGGSGASLTPVFALTNATIALAGTNYLVNDIAVVSGGTSSTAAAVQVLTLTGSNTVATISVVTNGSYTVLSTATTLSTTGGAGTGLTIRPIFNVTNVTVAAGGQEFTSTPTLSFTAGTVTATATANMATWPGNTNITWAQGRMGFIFTGQTNWSTY